jgi:sugar/nucleoside kinase (ribokinase family)
VDAWIVEQLGREQVVVDGLGRPHAVPVASVVVSPERGMRAVTSCIDTEPVVDTGAAAACADERLASSACLLVDGHYAALARVFAATATRAGVPVVVDAGSLRDELGPLLDAAAVVVAGQPFAAAAGGVDRALTRLGEHGVPWRAVTQGAGPIRWAGPSGDGEIAVESVAARDTNGAGDILHGAVATAVGRRGVPTDDDAFVALLRASASVASRAVAHVDPVRAIAPDVVARFEAMLG